MTSDQAYQLFNLYVNKDINGYFNPEEFELFFNRAQLEYFNDLIGPIEQYQPGRPIPPAAYDATGRVKHSLMPFMKESTVTLTNGRGNYNPSNDFAYYDAGSFRYYINRGDCTDPPTEPTGVKTMIPIKEMNKQAWANKVSSKIDYPTPRFPVLKFVNNSILEVSPTTIIRISFEYLKLPAEIYWGRTSVNGLFQHDPNNPNNVDPEWGELDMDNILLRAAKRAAINTDDQSLYGMARQTEKEGA